MSAKILTKMGLLAACVGLVVGCSDTEFKGSTTKKPQIKEEPIPTEKELNLTCSENQPLSELEAEVTGSSKTSVTLKGEFCNLKEEATSSDLTVLFILDFSGSMLGADPMVGDTCGRLQAADAILTKLQEPASQGAAVKAGIVPFGSSAMQETLPEAIDGFASRLTADTFCGSDGGGTNYEAALKKAEEILKNVEGQKVVYFISDGFPTAAGTLGGIGLPNIDLGADPYDAGKKAAESLRSTISDLTLNAIYLGSGSSSIPPTDSTLPTAEEYLEQITGDKERVKIVSNADSLASEIVKFDTPEVLTLDKSSVSGVQVVASYDQKSVEIDSIEPHPSRGGVWTFTTKPFDLIGESDKVLTNEVTFTVTASDGSEHTAVAKINFAIDAEAKTKIK